MYRVWGFLADYSLLLVIGALIALVWANVDPYGYHHFVETPLWANDLVGAPYDYWAKSYGSGAKEIIAPGPERVLSLHYLINDVLMAFFFAIAGKEVWEAVALKSGSLRGRKALTPLVATSGGMFGPIAVYLGLAAVMGSSTFDAVANGWAIPTATDIAFSYLVGRLIFGAGHPAVRFLLLLAIADDAAGLIILAIFYPSGDLAPQWLLVSFGAAVAVYVLANWLPRRLDRGKQDRPNSTFMRDKLGFWPYLVAGAICWYGFQESGIHPALGLLPIVATIPHADKAFGIFAAAEEHLTDLLNHIEHMLKYPVEVVLFFFGLMNAGVEFSSMGSATWLVLAGLIIGKPFGILLMGWLAAGPMKLGLPEGMRIVDLFILGCVAAIGFTVSLFIASVAFEAGPVQDAAKMGALLSFAAAGISFAVAKVIGVTKQES
ncbi:Na+/H+ antiporter NhaA [Algicella marina]|uniref:Na(+)/H(+) antiporter NhaA n=1 Tax=Algicella marina TaxID=2683284 RepID=A0A6P1T224_9RHOB|nr:Na+/H+ antiporter NhaA [Algicella marina]QHQ35506.1 sodium:proton antiporter [Algicella marina]